jgi:hypothetical protein
MLKNVLSVCFCGLLSFMNSANGMTFELSEDPEGKNRICDNLLESISESSMDASSKEACRVWAEGLKDESVKLGGGETKQLENYRSLLTQATGVACMLPSKKKSSLYKIRYYAFLKLLENNDHDTIRDFADASRCPAEGDLDGIKIDGVKLSVDEYLRARSFAQCAVDNDKVSSFDFVKIVRSIRPAAPKTPASEVVQGRTESSAMRKKDSRFNKQRTGPQSPFYYAPSEVSKKT